MPTYKNINDFEKTSEVRPPLKGEYYFAYNYYGGGKPEVRQATKDFVKWNAQRIMVPKEGAIGPVEPRDVYAMVKITNCRQNPVDIRHRLNALYPSAESIIVSKSAYSRTVRAMSTIGFNVGEMEKLVGE